VDEDGTFLNRANAFSVTVNNVAPALAISGAASVNEGSAYTINLSSSDPGADAIRSLTINWGDGAAPQAVSGNPSSVTHVYTDGPGSLTITATATDEDGTFSANALAVTVNNVAPTVSAVSPGISVDEGTIATNNGSFFEPGTDAVSIAASVGEVVINSDGTWS